MHYVRGFDLDDPKQARSFLRHVAELAGIPELRKNVEKWTAKQCIERAKSAARCAGIEPETIH